MFGILLKKQLREVFRSWFVNSKTGKARTKASSIRIITLFLVLMIAVIGGSFTAMAIGVSRPLIEADAGFIYFLMFGLISLAFGLFGSAFNTYSSLYRAKDNEMLLSLPIKTSVIVSSRIFTVYLMAILYSSIAFIPGMIVYQVIGGFNLRVLLGNIATLIEISLIASSMSCLLGYIIAKISLKIRNRSSVSVLASLLFMGLYYFVYFKAQFLIRDMVNSPAEYINKIKGSAYALYFWGCNACGQKQEMLICLGVSAVLAILIYLLLNNTFLKITTTSRKEKKKATVNKTAKVNSIQRAVLLKEFNRFTSSSNYMLNCGFGILFIPAAGIALLVKGDYLFSLISQNLGDFEYALPVGIVGIIFMFVSMIDTATPSVSLEGKEIWILQSLPIDTWVILKSKILMQLILSEIPLLFFSICLLTTPLSSADKIMCIILSLLYPVLASLFDMYIGIKMPMLNWTNEIVPIKQSGGVAISLFGGWGVAAVLIGVYIGLSTIFESINTTVYLAFFALIISVISIIIYRWLKRKGTKIFINL